MGQQSIPARAAAAIRDRVRTLRGTRSVAKFAEEVGHEAKSIAKWFARKSPTTPALPAILAIATKLPVNLNWLLLGEGSEMRGADRPLARLEEDLEVYVRGVVPSVQIKGVRDGVMLPTGPELLDYAVQFAKSFQRMQTERFHRERDLFAKRVGERLARSNGQVAKRLGPPSRQSIELGFRTIEGE